MAVSVITPSLNQAEFIGEAIRSVAEQNHPALEHIVVDGGSMDGTVSLLEGAAEDPRFRWVSEPDRGQAEAIAKGFALARGEVLGWLNADDVYLDSGVIERVAAVFAADEALDIVTGGGRYLTESGEALSRIEPPRPFRASRLRQRSDLLQPATFFRRRVVESTPLDTSLHYAFDWEFFARAASGRRVCVASDYYAGYRWYGRNKTALAGSRRTRELADVTARLLGRGTWQYGVLRLAAALDAAIDHAPALAKPRLRRGLYGGPLRAARILSRGAIQT